MSEALSIRWLKIACILTVLIGLTSWAASTEALGEPWRFLFDLLRWPLDGEPSGFDQDTKAVNAVLGGVLVGWGALMFLLVSSVGQAELRGVARSMLVAVIAWFLVDSSGSLLAGIPGNVVLNVVFLAVLVPPLATLATSPVESGTQHGTQ